MSGPIKKMVMKEDIVRFWSSKILTSLVSLNFRVVNPQEMK